MASIKIELDGSDLERRLEGVASIAWTPADLQELADAAAARIQFRTAQGLNWRDRPFRRYSKKYAAYRARKGRKKTPVTLLFDGLMLAAMISGVEGPEGVVKFSSAEAGTIADYHNSDKPRTKMPQRRFLGFHPKSKGFSMLKQLSLKQATRRLEEKWNRGG